VFIIGGCGVMGVDLRDLAHPVKISFSELTGKSIAVDGYNTLYQFLAIIRGEAGEHLKDSSGRVTSHLSGLFYRNMNLMSLGIKPIYVFDGRPPELKRSEIERRRLAKVQAETLRVEAFQRGDMVSAKKYASATSYLQDYMVEDAKRILDLMGIPWIVAPSEGEALAAHLNRIGQVDAAASQDYDSLLFGAKVLIRNVTISGRRKLPNRNVYINVEPERVQTDAVLRQLEITREQLVDIGILLGTDFNPEGFEGIGPAKALKLVKTYGSLEKVTSLSQELNLIDYQAIREIFLKPQAMEGVEFDWRPMDEDGIEKFLCQEKDFARERVRNALDKLKTSEGSRATESLDRWFK
jgi:flap endonuclease-1